MLRRLSLGIILPSILLISCSQKQEQQETVTEVETITVEAKETVLESVYPVEIYGQEDIEIRPRIDGFIKRINVTEGAVVRKGQSLFEIDSPTSEQAVLTAQAAVTSAEASLNTAKLNMDRIKPLADQGIVSSVQYDTYVNAHASAQAGLAQAKANLANAQATKSWVYVTSPVDGVIGSIPFRQGSLVDKASILTTVSNTEKSVYVYFSLDEVETIKFLNSLEGKTQAEKLKNAPEVTLTLKDGSKYPEKGKIESITGQMNISTGSAKFRAVFPNSNGILRSGTSGRISIPRTVENAIVIPQMATFQQQNKILTFILQGDSVVQTHVYVENTPDGKEYVVNEGLKPGDKIVSHGLTMLRNGQKVKEANK
jgi:membrane fusion protein (multidrug efflux system)